MSKGKGRSTLQKPKSKGRTYKGNGKAKSTSKSKRSVTRRARARRAFSHSDGSASDAFSLSEELSDTDSQSSASSDSGSEQLHYETDRSEGLVGDAEVVAILRAERKASAARGKKVQCAAAAPRLKERKDARRTGVVCMPHLVDDDDKDEDTDGVLHLQPGKRKSAYTVAATPRTVGTARRSSTATQPSPLRTVATLTEQLFEVARIRDTVRADLSAEPWQMDMFEHVFTLFGNVLISVGGLHAQVDCLLACVKAQYRPPPTDPSTPASGMPTASPLPVFAETVDEFNQITGRSVSRSVLWTDEEARVDFARTTGVAALTHNTPVPFAHIVRDEDGQPVSAARLKTIRAVIREAVAELEALPDKRVPNQSGVLPNRCRTYFQTYHRFAFLQTRHVTTAQ